jgi:pimeloyl-ACP methyl ester carboxylesterase
VPRLDVGEVALNYLDRGRGNQTVLAIHGNLGCAEWLGLVLPLLPDSLRVIAPDWRGCGDSDKPAPAPDYANYAMRTHALDMLALLDALGIGRCHLYGHSTGGIICSHMLAEQPARFGNVLLLDPVTPLGLALAPAQIGFLRAMKESREVAFAGLASAAPTLFLPDTLLPGRTITYAQQTTRAQRDLFERLVDRTRVLSDGIWFGTPYNLAREWASGALAAQMASMRQAHRVLYGELDAWIPRAHVEQMAAQLPRCTLQTFPGIGHSMSLEAPQRLAEIFEDYFGSEAPTSARA